MLSSVSYHGHGILSQQKEKKYDNHTFLSSKGQAKPQKFWERKRIVPKVDPANAANFNRLKKVYQHDHVKIMKSQWAKKWNLCRVEGQGRTGGVSRPRSSSGWHLLCGLTHHVRCQFLIHTTELSLWLSDWNVYRSRETVRSPWLTLSTLQRLQLPLSFVSIL